MARFRAGLRPRAIGSRYQGWAHLAFTSFASLAVIGFAASRVRAPTWRELLVVPAAFLISNAAEYFGHQGPMHRKVSGLGLVFRRHP